MDQALIEGSREETDALWAEYKATGSREARDRLLISYTPLVRQVVRRMMPKYSAHTEYDDLVSCGVLGLIDAVEKYDPKVGVKFETYAVTRVRGEILDSLRSQDWAPSSLRKKINIITRAYDEIESVTGETPSDEAVAGRVGIPVAQVQKVMAKTHAFNLVNFEDTLTSCYTAVDIEAPEHETPESRVIDGEVKRILVETIESLPEKERLVITLYYYEELMLKEIAQVLGVSESRVSQIHSKVIGKMRLKLQKIL